LANQTYLVVGTCKVIDGDAITLVLGNNSEAKLRVKAGLIVNMSDLVSFAVISGAAFFSPLGHTHAADSKWKQSVKVATTTNGTLSTAFENGDTVDGVTLTTGDRILLKNQSTGSQNGIYTVNASGAPTRATDANTGESLVQAVVFVEQGTSNADKCFVCFTNRPITIDVTTNSWIPFVSTLGFIDGSQISDSTLDLIKISGSGIDTNSLMYFDGSSWTRLSPPVAKSVLTHDGGGDPPYWEPV